jgi:hypothetical protein
MRTDQIIGDLLEIRRSLFMWKMSLEAVDRLLEHVDYDTSKLEQYDFSGCNHMGRQVQTAAAMLPVPMVDLLKLV